MVNVMVEVSILIMLQVGRFPFFQIFNTEFPLNTLEAQKPKIICESRICSEQRIFYRRPLCSRALVFSSLEMVLGLLNTTLLT